MELSPMQIMLENMRDEKSMRALSNGLRNRKDLGELLSLVGTSNQKNFGGGLRADVGFQQGMKEKQDNRALMESQYGAANEHRGNVLKETIRHNQAMEDYYKNRESAGSRMKQKDFDNNVRKFSEKMTQMGIPELQYDVNRINTALKPYIDDGSRDIPGIGKTGKIPNMFVSDEGVQIRQGLAAVRNKLLKVRSGAAVTDPEMARFAQELITTMDTISTDRELVLSWPKVAEGIRQIEAGIAAGYDPEVTQTFYGRYSDLTGGGQEDSTQWGDVSPPQEGNVVDWSSM